MYHFVCILIGLNNKENFSCSATSNLLKIEETTSAGKQAVANRTIYPGDALMSENPTASCLLPNFYDTHCQTCLRRYVFYNNHC